MRVVGLQIQSNNQRQLLFLLGRSAQRGLYLVRAKIKEILEHWIDLDVDAFMLVCGGYIGASSGNFGYSDYTPETAADWISCSLPGLRRPFRGVRRVMVVPCLLRRPSRCRGTWRPSASSTKLSCMAHPREGIFRAGRQTRRLSLCRN